MLAGSPVNGDVANPDSARGERGSCVSAIPAAIGWSQTAAHLVAYLERRTPWDS
jgi:hypothetical protein